MQYPVEKKIAFRLRLVGILTTAWALAIAGRLVWLQVVQHDELTRLASGQQHTTVEIPADRGEILDRTGHPLAVSIRTEDVIINPQRVADAGFFAANVAPVLGLDQAELEAGIVAIQKAVEESRKNGESARNVPGRGFRVLKRHITAEEKKQLRSLPFRFFEFLRNTRREYPNGRLAAHVIGSVDAEGRGNAGIEQKLEEELRGRPGKMRVLTDPLRGPFISWVSDPGRQGANLTLSIHSVIQHDAEVALEEGVRAAGAKGGSVVVMDPRNGEVLALANLPTFDPRNQRPAPAEFLARQNIATQAPCEPGSVMKMITVAMGIETGRFTEDSVIFCENGAFRRSPRRVIHDLHGYGALKVSEVLIKSSNIGVAKISLAAGPSLLSEYLEKFGIGRRTGIELPGESRGQLEPLDRWTPISHEYMAFGHELGATALQLARAVSVVANGGLLVQPHLVIRREVPIPGAGVETVPIRHPEPRRVLSPETSFTLRRIMERVVLEGTGKRARIPGYSSGGKTGSAEIFEKGTGWVNRHNSSFIGFAPVVNPRVVVVVTLNNTPKQGGTVAAPVFSRVALSALRVLNVPKDKPETDVDPLSAIAPSTGAEPAEEPVRSPARTEEKAIASAEVPQAESPVLVGPRVPDLRGKNTVAVIRECASRGLPLTIAGEGIARAQRPEPGSLLPPGGKIHVEFSRN
jgi:cell division protein FtsI (penicillin-binding protein 3)